MAEVVDNPVEEAPSAPPDTRRPGTGFFYLINNKPHRPEGITSARVNGNESFPDRFLKSRSVNISHDARQGHHHADCIYLHIIVDNEAHREIAVTSPDDGRLKLILDTPEEVRDALLRGPLADKIFEEARAAGITSKYRILYQFAEHITKNLGRGYYADEVYKSGILDGLPSATHCNAYIIPAHSDRYMGDAPDGVLQFFLASPNWSMTPCQKCGSGSRIYGRASYDEERDARRYGLVSLDSQFSHFVNLGGNLITRAQMVVACIGCEQRVMAGVVNDFETVIADWNSVQEDRKAGRPARRAQPGSSSASGSLDEAAEPNEPYIDVDDFLQVELAGLTEDVINLVKQVYSEAQRDGASTIIRQVTPDRAHAVIGNSRGAVEIINLGNGMRMSLNLTELRRRQ